MSQVTKNHQDFKNFLSKMTKNDQHNMKNLQNMTQESPNIHPAYTKHRPNIPNPDRKIIKNGPNLGINEESRHLFNLPSIHYSMLALSKTEIWFKSGLLLTASSLVKLDE